MSVALKKLDGVQEAKVSLNEGVAIVTLKPNNTVTVDQVRKIVRSNGFTPKETDIRVSGKLVERGGRPALEVSGLGFTYLLKDHHDAQGKVAQLQKQPQAKEVTLRGHVPEGPETDPNQPPVLEVLE